MVTKLPAVDIAIVGMGWAGSILAKELASTGLKIVGFERGEARATQPDFVVPMKEDEIRYSRRHELMQDVARETLTFRNNMTQAALPMRRLGSFLPGEGVGGSGLHWGAATSRLMSWDFEARKQTLERYGPKIIPANMNLQDWGLTYTDLEPFYEKFERCSAASGKAGNLNGTIVEGGNIFEEPRQSEYPNPPLQRTHSVLLFEQATRRLGYHPYPSASSIASQGYLTPDNVQYGPCHYCGFCSGYGCQANAKASPHIALLPVALRSPTFELRTSARVLKINLDSTGKKATGVTYIDARGRELMQPADLVILSAFSLANVHLMLLSRIGKPYDPKTGRGVVGRNYSYQLTGRASGLFDEGTFINPFMGSGGLTSAISDFHANNCDFSKTGFIGDGLISSNSGGIGPIAGHPVPTGTPRWGTAWKKGVVRAYNHTAEVSGSASVMSYKQNFLDLDPTYKDAFGRPLMRLTFDFDSNEIKLAQYNAAICARIVEEMGAEKVQTRTSPFPYSIVPYQSTHNVGGAVLGTDPATSAVNTFLQSWDIPNVFVVGGSAFPQNSAKPPTATIGALAFRTADAIKNRYLSNPGALMKT